MTKYEKIANALKLEIMSGKYRDGLPSECRLAGIHKVAPLTARKALDELAKEGLIIRSPGRASQINEDMIAPVRICLNCEDKTLDEIRTQLQIKFPGTNFILDNDVAQRFSGMYDITFNPTTFLDSYDRHFSPFPSSVVDEVKKSDLFRDDVMELHQTNGLYYGLPIVYSPPVMEMNCELLKQIKVELPEQLDFNVLQQCHQALQKLPEQPALFERDTFAEMLMFHFFYMHLPKDWHVMTDEGWLELCDKALTNYYLLVENDVVPSGDFNKGQALFRFVGMDFHHDKLSFPTSFFPCFGPSEFPVHALSVSLVISRNAANPNRLVKICRAFLDPEIQRLFKDTLNKGIPVRKSTAYEVFCNAPACEQIFMHEDKRCMFKRPEPIKELIGTIWTDIPLYLHGSISAEDLRVEVHNSMRAILKKRAVGKKNLNQVSQ